MLLCRVRQWVAVALLALGALDTLPGLAGGWLAPSYRFDPAALFYGAAGVGLALQVFWARYLAICFAAALTANSVVWGHGHTLLTLGGGLAFILLLAGRSMRQLFDERAGRCNRWADALDRRVDRLRLLFVAQSVLLVLLFAGRFLVVFNPWSVIGATALLLVGLIAQRTWAVLAILPVIGVQAYVVTAGLTIPHGACGLASNMATWQSYRFTAVGLLACLVSVIVIAPLVRAVCARAMGRPAS